MSEKVVYMLAKMAPKGVDYMAVPGGSGGGLTQMDVAAACSQLTPFQQRLVRAKYCADTMSWRAVVVDVMEALSEKEGKTQEFTKPALVKLAKSITDEVVNPRRCPKCSGTGYVRAQMQAPRACPSCSATGAKSISQSYRARGVGMAESTWRHHRMGEVCDSIIKMLTDNEVEALNTIGKRLAG